jgi:hypothetical protein
LRKYNSDVATKNALYGAAQQNGQNAINDVANFGILAANGAFGGGGGGNSKGKQIGSYFANGGF